MIIVENSPDAIALAGVERDVLNRRASDLPSADREVWRSLSGNADILTSDVEPGGFSRLYVVDRAPSSQFDVLRALPTPPDRPIACAAVTGRGFHGHRGRAWDAPAGNVHLSVALPAGGYPASGALAFTMLPAVAAAETVTDLSKGAADPGIKWVNDLLLDERKVGGVLTATSSEGERLDLVVLGIGLNVATAPRVAPTPFVPGTTRLKDAPGCASAVAAVVLRSLLARIFALYGMVLADKSDAIFAAYRSRSLVVGRRVRVFEEGLDDTAGVEAWPAPLARGIVTEVHPDLSLRIEGLDDPISRGRLAFEESCIAFFGR